MEANVKSIFLVEWYSYDRGISLGDNIVPKYITHIPSDIMYLVEASKAPVLFLEDSLVRDLYESLILSANEFADNTKSLLFDVLKLRSCSAVVLLASGSILDYVECFLENNYPQLPLNMYVQRYGWKLETFEDAHFVSFSGTNKPVFHKMELVPVPVNAR